MRGLLTKVTYLLFAALISQYPLNGQNTEENTNYRLSPHDLIEVSHLEEPELKIETRIDGSGSINLPLVGKTKVGGKTLEEAEQFVESEYIRQRFLKKPEVLIFIKEYGTKEVSILGEVAKPGVTPFPSEKNDMTIVEAISRAGGFTRIAKSSDVTITRQLADGRQQNFVINVSQILKGNAKGKTANEPFIIRPGDVIFVPQRAF